MGFYRAYINDFSVTSNVFMPGWTSYLNRVQYQVYDVTKLLSEKSMLSILFLVFIVFINLICSSFLFSYYSFGEIFGL